MRDLFIYHPGTGTMISLSDPVYVVDTAVCTKNDLEDFSNGVASQLFTTTRGYRLDNGNMSRLFWRD